ncbi:hypothetical protein [Arthrobacter tecti]
MGQRIRLDIDLSVSLHDPDAAGQPGEGKHGTVTAAGSEVTIY